MKTIYGLDVKTQWNQILDLHALKLAREHHQIGIIGSSLIILKEQYF